MMQHGIFFITYESTGGELGPTTEIFGDFAADSSNDVKVKLSYIPEALKSRAEYFFKEENEDDFHFALNGHFNTTLDTDVNIIRQGSP